jgi:hypothetical protein
VQQGHEPLYVDPGFDIRHLRLGDSIRLRFDRWLDEQATNCEVILDADAHRLGRWCVSEHGQRPCAAPVP